MLQITEIESLIDASQQMGSRHMIVEIERVKKLVLLAIQLTHHGDSLLVNRH
jgi:hypothetical protein